MSGTVLSRTDRHTAHSSGAARSTAALRRTAAAAPATAPTAPVVPRQGGGEQSADAAESEPAAPSPPPPTIVASPRTDAPAVGVPSPAAPGAALTVTLAIPLTGEALTPEAYRLLEALRDLVERGQGTVTTTGPEGVDAAGAPRHAPPRDAHGATGAGLPGGSPRAAVEPAFSDAGVGAPTFGGPTRGGPAFSDAASQSVHPGQAPVAWASDGRPTNGSAGDGLRANGSAFGADRAAPAGPALAGPALAGPELADPDVLAHGPGRPSAFGAPRGGVFRADPAPSDVEWVRAADRRPVDPTEVRLLTASRQVLLGGVPLAMTRLEFDLLMFLAGNPRRVFTRAQLLGAVWGYEHTGERTVDVHVRRLRVKMGVQVPLITTVYGVGYRLDDDARIVVVSHG